MGRLKYPERDKYETRAHWRRALAQFRKASKMSEKEQPFYHGGNRKIARAQLRHTHTQTKHPTVERIIRKRKYRKKLRSKGIQLLPHHFPFYHDYERYIKA